jgi:hypothetical protein
VSRGFVYMHARELGAVRLGAEPSGRGGSRLRFDVEAARARLVTVSHGDESDPKETR